MQVEKRLIVMGHEGVDIHDARNALRGAIGDPSCHHPAIAVTEQHDIAQVLEFEDDGEARAQSRI